MRQFLNVIKPGSLMAITLIAAMRRDESGPDYLSQLLSFELLFRAWKRHTARYRGTSMRNMAAGCALNALTGNSSVGCRDGQPSRQVTLSDSAKPIQTNLSLSRIKKNWMHFLKYTIKKVGNFNPPQPQIKDTKVILKKTFLRWYGRVSPNFYEVQD